MNRRTLLGTLGLAPAAIGAEAFLPPEPSGHIQIGNVATKETMVRAIRALADEIEAGRIDMVGIRSSCDVAVDKIVMHRIDFELAYRPEA